MLKLFSKHGAIFRLTAILAWLFWFFHLLDVVVVERFQNEIIIFLILGCLATLIEGMALYPWYQRSCKGLGIEEHFENVSFLVVYLFFFVNVLKLFEISSIFLEVFLSVLFFLLLVTDLVLLRYHFRDKDPTPPAFYSKNLFLKGTNSRSA